MKPLPDDFNDLDVCGAALALALAGYFVFPVKGESGGADPMAWKAPAVAHWPTQSTRDPKEIAASFAGTSGLGVAIDCGKSGLVVIDEDHPGLLDGLLVPTLVDVSGRDGGGFHHLYLQPPGRNIGTRAGELPAGFGEVRGAGGYVVAAPSPHAAGRRYRFVDPTVVPVTLPGGIASKLPDREDRAAIADDAEVAAFIEQHTVETKPGLLKAVLDRAEKAVADGQSRHDTAVKCMCWAMREAQAGYYSAERARSTLRRWFAEAINGERDIDREWAGIVGWAVAQAKQADPAETRAAVDGRIDCAGRGRDVDALLEVLHRYQDLDDVGHILVTLAAAASAAVDDEPVWVLLVAPPSTGKTEAVRLLDDVTDAHLNEITAAGLLSWSKGKPPRPVGVLARIGERGLVTFGDMSSLLATSDRGGRDQVFGLLRRTYDGRVTRDLGHADRPLSWEGRATVVGAVTAAIDRYAAHADALGPRWVYFRLPERQLEAKRRAGDLARVGGLDQLRKDARAVAAKIVNDARRRIVDVTVPDGVFDELVDAAIVTCWGRGVVPRNGYGRREIEGMAEVEESPRLTRQLLGLARGLLAIGCDEACTARLIRRVALDSMPAARRAVLAVLANGEADLTTAAMAAAAGLHRQVARMQLEELEVIGVVAGNRGGSEPDDDEVDRRRCTWTLSGNAGQLTQRVFLAERAAQ